MKWSIICCIVILLLHGFERALGSDFKAGEKILITEPVNGDLYLAAGDIEVRAPVYGDLIASGGEISVEDSVMQDLLIAGGELFLNGFVGDDIRAAGGKVNITNVINGDLVVFGGQVNIDGIVIGDLIVFGGEVNIRGTIRGNIKAGGGKVFFGGIAEGITEFKAGEVEIAGEVRGLCKIIAEDIYVGEQAKFYEAVEYWRNDGEMDFGSSLINTSAHYNPEFKSQEGRGLWGIAFSGLIIFYVLSVILILILLNFLLNKPLSLAAAKLNNEPLRALVYGIVYFLGLPIVIFLLMLTVIGIPIGLLTLALYIFSWVFGLSMASVITAKVIKIKYNHQQWGTWMLVLVSMGVFTVLKVITLIPFIGWLGYLFIVAFAFGALLFGLKPKKLVEAQQ